MCDRLQRENDPHFDTKFCYLTIRCGELPSSDTTWHVDGFQAGLRQALKRAETNYVWADRQGTEFFEGRLDWAGIDPQRHNVHEHMEAQIAKQTRRASFKAAPGQVLAMTPYMPHRKPLRATQGFRRFVRVTFSEAEIQDDTCATNPALAMPRYDNTDVRWRLEAPPSA